eukprot:gene10340-biopygen10656
MLYVSYGADSAGGGGGDDDDGEDGEQAPRGSRSYRSTCFRISLQISFGLRMASFGRSGTSAAASPPPPGGGAALLHSCCVAAGAPAGAAAEGVAEAKLLTVEPSSDPRWSDRAPLMPAGRQLCGRNGLRLENTCLWLGEAGARAPLPMMTAADQTGHPDAAAHHGAGAESLCEGYLSKPPDLNRILPRTPLNQGCRVPDPVCLEVGDELAQGAAHAWRESGRCRAVSERPRAPTKVGVCRSSPLVVRFRCFPRGNGGHHPGSVVHGEAGHCAD